MRKLVSHFILTLPFTMPVMAHLHPSQQHYEEPHEQAQFIVLEASRTGPLLKLSDSTGKLQTLYQVSKRARLFQFDHALHKPEMLLAYAPGRDGKQGIWRFEYVLRPGQKATVRLTPVLTDDNPKTWYFDPVYIPGSDDFYFVTASVDKHGKRASQNLRLWRYYSHNQQQQLIAENASRPAISETGKLLIWQSASSNGTTLHLLDMQTDSRQSWQTQKPELKLHSPQISDAHQASFFLSTESRLATIIPGFSAAWAHAGTAHESYFAWQLPRTADSMTGAQLLWEATDVRDVKIHPNNDGLGYLDHTGLHWFDMQHKTRKRLLAGPNFYKIAWVTEQQH